MNSNDAIVNHELRTLYLLGDVDNDTTSALLQGLLEIDRIKSKKPITLFIHSSGGDVDHAFAIYDTIKLCKAPVIGVVLGLCESSAGLILQACNTRFMTPNARFMIHAGTLGISRNHAKEARAYMEEAAGTMEKFDKLLAARTKYTPAELAQIGQFAKYYNAQEAVEHGFADKVLLRPALR